MRIHVNKRNQTHAKTVCTASAIAHKFHEMSEIIHFGKKKKKSKKRNDKLCAHSRVLHVIFAMYSCAPWMLCVRAIRFDFFSNWRCSRHQLEIQMHTMTTFDVYHDFWSSHAFSCKQLHSKIYNAENGRIERTPFILNKFCSKSENRTNRI